MPICDGCGSQVDEAHIRHRIVRLEQATRFRPIHIKFLILGAAPPGRPEDFFYQLGSEGLVRSLASQDFFDEFAMIAGISPPPVASADEEAVFSEFQRGGFFLAHAVECPVAGERELNQAVEFLAPVVVRRIRFSYRPRYVVPIGSAIDRLIQVFGSAGLGDSLILGADNSAFHYESATDRPRSAGEGDSLGARVRAAISSLL